MITNINDNLKTIGIYKITYDNGKIYIGQALSIYSRALEHNNKSKYPCDKALKKHNATIEILETVLDITQLDEKEIYYIDKFNATDKSIGYNILPGGNASNKQGTNNCNAALNQEQLIQIIDLLRNRTELSYQDIACQFDVQPCTIYRISKGLSYIQPNIIYPIRQDNHESQLKNSIYDYFESEEDLLNLKNDLYYRWDLSIEQDLTKQYNIPVRIMHEINNGNKFTEYGNYEYPIRKKNIRNNNNFTQQDIYKILSLLKNTNKSMAEIGSEFNIHRDTVSKINKGKAYIIKDYPYPARD